MAGQKLQRIALAAPNTIDLVGDGSNGGNYLSNVGMDYITGMTLNSDGNLAISGMSGSTAVNATIDGNGNITINSPTNVPLDQLVSL